MDLEDLARQGISVDDENKPVPENANPHVEGAAPSKGTWEKPAIFVVQICRLLIILGNGQIINETKLLSMMSFVSFKCAFQRYGLSRF
jgi:hypothetical protein